METPDMNDGLNSGAPVEAPQNTPSGSSKKWLWLAVLGVVVGAGVAGYLWYSSSNEVTDEQPPSFEITSNNSGAFKGMIDADIDPNDIACRLPGNTEFSEHEEDVEYTTLKKGMHVYTAKEDIKLGDIPSLIRPVEGNIVTAAYYSYGVGAQADAGEGFYTDPKMSELGVEDYDVTIPANESFILITCGNSEIYGVIGEDEEGAALPAILDDETVNKAWILTGTYTGVTEDLAAYSDKVSAVWPQTNAEAASLAFPDKLTEGQLAHGDGTFNSMWVRINPDAVAGTVTVADPLTTTEIARAIVDECYTMTLVEALALEDPESITACELANGLSDDNEEEVMAEIVVLSQPDAVALYAVFDEAECLEVETVEELITCMGDDFTEAINLVTFDLFEDIEAAAASEEAGRVEGDVEADGGSIATMDLGGLGGNVVDSPFMSTDDDEEEVAEDPKLAEQSTLDITDSKVEGSVIKLSYDLELPKRGGEDYELSLVYLESEPDPRKAFLGGDKNKEVTVAAEPGETGKFGLLILPVTVRDTLDLKIDDGLYAMRLEAKFSDGSTVESGWVQVTVNSAPTVEIHSAEFGSDRYVTVAFDYSAETEISNKMLRYTVGSESTQAYEMEAKIGNSNAGLDADLRKTYGDVSIKNVENITVRDGKRMTLTLDVEPAQGDTIKYYFALSLSMANGDKVRSDYANVAVGDGVKTDDDSAATTVKAVKIDIKDLSTTKTTTKSSSQLDLSLLTNPTSTSSSSDTSSDPEPEDTSTGTRSTGGLGGTGAVTPK